MVHQVLTGGAELRELAEDFVPVAAEPVLVTVPVWPVAPGALPDDAAPVVDAAPDVVEAATTERPLAIVL